METFIRIKFDHSELKEKLMATKDGYLTEGNTWHDNDWGSCVCEKCEDIPGLNKLGKILMKIRNEKR